MDAVQAATLSPVIRVAERPVAPPVKVEPSSEAVRVIAMQDSKNAAQEQQAAKIFAERSSKPATAVSTSYDPVMKSLVITTVSNDTGEVVSQLPSKELLALAHRTAEFRAKFLDVRA